MSSIIIPQRPIIRPSIANYAELDTAFNTGPTYSNNDLTADWNQATHTEDCVRANTGISSGAYYWEFLLDVVSANDCMWGIVTGAATGTGMVGFNNDGFGIWNGDGYIYLETVTATGYNSRTTGITTYNNGDVLMVAFDRDANELWFGRNGTWSSGDPGAGTLPNVYGISSGTMYPAIASDEASASITLRFNPADFSYSAPSGFDPLTE